MDKREKKGLAIGAVIGAVFGVIGGILFAPKSGKETRKDIKDAANKTADKLVEEARTVQAETKELLAKAEGQFLALKGKAQDQATAHVNEIKHNATQIGTALKSFKAGTASDKDLQEAITRAKQAQASLKKFLTK
ncbi:MAG TPA: YtxH domain-containing protein [Candidatus Saccharibacteria bacterium]|nr:YtxH domain-containing protein [Candidatus Saccharibacteria bacterium]